MASAEALKIGEWRTKEKMICKENVTLSSYSVQQLVDQGLCASYYMQSKPGTFPVDFIEQSQLRAWSLNSWQTINFHVCIYK